MSSGLCWAWWLDSVGQCGQAGRNQSCPGDSRAFGVPPDLDVGFLQSRGGSEGEVGIVLLPTRSPGETRR